MRLLHLLVLLIVLATPVHAESPFIILQSTTSTKNSGLFDHLLPQFREATGVDVRVVAVGTGQAIRNASNGDGDVLLVHAKTAEEAFVAEGHGITRADVMYNDFVIVGDDTDPAGIAGMTDVTEALRKLAAQRGPFVSRADDSGTHKAEMRLWSAAGVNPVPASGKWYFEAGQGMGATLNMGTSLGAYVLTDRATWIAFGAKARHRILVEGDERLFNQYGIIAVSPARHPNVKADLAAQFVNWILSPAGQGAIAAYRVDGQQLFFPNAHP